MSTGEFANPAYPKRSLRVVFSLTLVILNLVSSLSPVAAFKPELVAQTGHTDSVNSVAISSNGKTLVSGSSDKSIKVWDLSSGKLVRSLRGHTDDVNSVCFSTDGKTIASGSRDKSIKIWDLESGKQIFALTGHRDSVTSVAFFPDGKTLASGSWDKSIKIWDLASKRVIKNLTGHTDGIMSISIAPNGKTLASGSADKSIRLWNLQSQKVSRRLIHSNAVTSVAFAPDGKKLASGTVESNGHGDMTLKIWEVSSGKQLSTFSGHNSSIRSVAFSPDSKTLASGSDDESIKLWDVASAKFLRTLAGHKVPILSLAFSPDGKSLAAGSAYKSITIWNSKSGKELCRLTGVANLGNAITMSADGTTIALGGEEIITWNLDTGKVIRAQSGGTVSAIALSPDGKTLAAGSWNKSRINIWDLVSKRFVCSLSGHENLVTSLDFSSDGKTLVSGSWDRTIKLWDISSGKSIRSMNGHKGCVSAVKISPDGTHILSGSWDESLKIWDLQSGREIRSLNGHANSVSSIAISPDGKLIASGGWDNFVKVWDFPSGKLVSTLKGHTDAVSSIAFSPDGKTLASGSEDNSIKIWDLLSGTINRSLIGHTDPVVYVAFSPDEQTLASGSAHSINLRTGRGNSSIKLWNVSTESEIVSLFSINQNHWAAVTPAGHFDSSTLDEDLSSLAWVLPEERMRAYPLEIFMKQYFEPNLLKRLKKGENLPAVPPLETINRSQPIVTIDSITPHKNSLDLVDVRVSFQSTQSELPDGHRQRSGVYNFRLLRGGKLVAYLPNDKSFNSEKLIDLSNGIDNKVSHTFTVKLPHIGESSYQFSAFAFNADQVKSNTAKASHKVPKPLRKEKGRAYVVSFGVNEYEDSNWNLSYAAADAREYAISLVPRLKDQENLSEVIPISLVSPSIDGELPATKETLRDVLLTLSGKETESGVAKKLRDMGIQRTEPEDFVLLSFSCHGATNETTGEFYLFPTNIGKNQDQGLTLELENHGISSSELTDWIKDIDAAEIILIIDACHSGAAEGRGFKPGPMGSRGLGQLAYFKAMSMLSASQAAGKAKELSKLGHGLLTFALLKEGLSLDGRADTTPKDKRVCMNELLLFASEEVPRLDQGNFKSKSVDEAMSTDKNISTVSTKGAKRELQVPLLRDFRTGGSNQCVLILK
jgi:WD40 repeat protein/uncharacterized caspase-like protein